MRFFKMQAAGNDYVYVDVFSREVENPGILAARVSDRHFGVGGDGLVLIGPSAVADARMRMFNADGTEAQMCGNAIRCVAKYLYDSGRCRKREMTVETGAGVRALSLAVEGGAAARVRVDMGEPLLAPARIPLAVAGERFVNEEVEIDGALWRITAVSMGNPHAVVFAEDIEGLDLARLGPAFEHHGLFPERVNAEFVAVLDRRAIAMRVWERGAGETLACGTGACAAVVACVLNGRTDRDVLVRVPGGELGVFWDEKDNHVFLSGGAHFVFSGDYVMPGETPPQAGAL